MNLPHMTLLDMQDPVTESRRDFFAKHYMQDTVAPATLGKSQLC